MKLKLWAEILLNIITGALFIVVLMVDYLSLKAVPVYLLAWLLIVVNAFVLKKYGKGVFL